MKTHPHRAGFTIIEVLVGLSILVTLFLVIYQTLTLFFNNENRLLASTQALYLAEAGQEYVRYLRDEDWSSFTALSTGSAHYLSVATSSVTVSGTAETIGQFERRFVLWPVYRDSNDDPVASTTPGAVADPDSFIVNTVVTWDNDQQVMLQSILGNLKNL